jgi:hypothetical protein
MYIASNSTAMHLQSAVCASPVSPSIPQNRCEGATTQIKTDPLRKTNAKAQRRRSQLIHSAKQLEGEGMLMQIETDPFRKTMRRRSDEPLDSHPERQQRSGGTQ